MKRFVYIVVSVALCLIVGILGILCKYKLPIITKRITHPNFFLPIAISYFAS